MSFFTRAKLIFAAFFLSYIHANCQSTFKDSIYLQMEKGFELANHGKLEEGERVVKEAYELTERRNDKKASFTASIGYINFLAQIKREEVAISFGLGILETIVADFGNVSFETSTAHNTLAILYASVGEYHHSANHFNEALKLIQEIYGENSFYSAGCLNNLASVYEVMHEYEKAENYYLKSALTYESLQIDTLSYKRTTINLAEVYGNFSVLLRKMRKFNAANNYSAKSLGIIKDLHGVNSIKYLKEITALGGLLYETADFSKSLHYYLKADSLADLLYKVDHIFKSEIKVDLAQLYMVLGNYDEAYNIAKETLLKRSTLSYEELLVECHLLCAEYLVLKEKREEALNHLHTAEKFTFERRVNKIELLPRVIIAKFHLYLKMGLLVNSENEIEKFESLRKTIENNSQFQELYQASQIEMLKLEIYEAKFHQSNESALLENMLMSVRTIDSIKVMLDDLYFMDDDRLHHNKNYKPLFDKGVFASWKLYELTQNQQYIITAFNFMERGKATALLEGLLERQDYKHEGERVRDLIIKINHLEKQQQENTKESEGYVEADLQILKLWKEYYALKDSVNQIQSSHSRPQLSSRITHEDLKGMIMNNMLVEYYSTDSMLFMIGADNSKLIFKSHYKERNFDNYVETFGISLTTEHSDLKKIQRNGNWLYIRVLQPILNELDGETLVVIPDRSLSSIPFEVLSYKQDKYFHYLVNRLPISYSYSAALLKQSQCILSTEKKENYAAFLPDYSSMSTDDNQGYYSSIHFSSEVARENQREVLGGDLYMNDQATFANLSAQGGKYHILHIIAHGEIDDQDHMNSGFLFKNDSLSLSRLVTSEEIYSLKINNNLTILNSCHAEEGVYIDQEGVMSLSRAFLLAGSRSLMTTKWSAPDQSSARITQDFVRYISNGKSKAKSLQLSKLDYLGQSIPDRLKHPFFWSSLVLIGDNSSVELNENSFFTPLKLGGIVFLCLLLFSILWYLMGRRANEY